MEVTIHALTTTKTIELNDERAFEELYKDYFVRLYRFCYSIVHVKEAAEEIVNDVFLNLWKKSAAAAAIHNLEVYLYVSVKNLSLNYLRNNQFIQTVDIEERIGESTRFQADPESLLVSSENMKTILGVIENLPLRCKLIFKLVKEDGLKYKDVAKLLDLSVRTVETQLALAMKKILLAVSNGFY